nr:DMT family protein [Taibaiella koreensis]
MTYAWYGHLISCGIAFFDYVFMVPANNRFGKQEGFSPFQLKTMQEIVLLTMFFLLPCFSSGSNSGGTT